MSTKTPASPTRRAIARGAAWSIPAIAITSAAPAFAASGACPQIPDASGWGLTTSGNVVNPRVDRNGPILSVFTDAADAGGSALTFATSFAITAGASYSLRVELQTAKGYSTDCTSTNSKLDVRARVAGSRAYETIGSFYTQSGTGTQIVPPDGCTDGTPHNEIFGSGGTQGASTVSILKLPTATANGNVDLRFGFALDGTTMGNNDDWRFSITVIC